MQLGQQVRDQPVRDEAGDREHGAFKDGGPDLGAAEAGSRRLATVPLRTVRLVLGHAEEAIAVRSRSRDPPGPARAATRYGVRIAVRLGQRPPGQLHPGRAQRLGRERDGLGPHQLQLRELGWLSAQEVQQHPGAEAAGTDAEPGVTGRVRQPALVRGAEERAEPRAGVDHAAPLVAEPHALQLRERLEEMRASLLNVAGRWSCAAVILLP